jgi:hypothetical protein
MKRSERSTSSDMENPDISAWVQSRIELLAAPADWAPDLRRALARHASRAEATCGERTRPLRVLLAVVGVAVALSIAAIVLSRGAVLAQTSAGEWHPFEEAWNWVTVVWRGPVLLLGSPGAALRVETVKAPGESQLAANAGEAGALAGFAPRLPDATFLPPPQIAVNGALATAANWEGQRLTLEIGATVTATWRGTGGWSELLLIQGQLPVITMSPAFDLQAFGIGALGLPRRRPVPDGFPWILFGRTTSAPAILSGYLPQQLTAFKEVKLSAGPATLMEECSKREGGNRLQVDRITLLWNVADRAYVLRGERESSPSVQGWDSAAALTSVIEIANTIR